MAGNLRLAGHDRLLVHETEMTGHARHPSRRAGSLVQLVTLVILGCGSDHGAPMCGAEQSAIVSGTETPASVQLSDEQANAIVRVRLGSDTDDEFCSGVMLAEDWVLSARHCSIGLPALVDFGPDAERPSASVRTASSITHPDLDLALFLLVDRDGEPPLDFESLQAWTSTVDTSWIGRDAELAGYGTTETEASGQRLFVSETIVQVDDTFITVDGAGRSGACTGDSGGPLLVATNAGEPAVAGILSTGSADCRGIDRYVRVDRVWHWLTRHIPELRASAGTPPVACD
jgi:hypothetical protein